MKLNYWLIAMLSLGTLVSNAKRIEMIDAQAIASDFMAQKVVNVQGVQKTNVVKLRKAAMPKSAVTSEYYVFNNENGAGYVVVAGDDEVTPILGYSDSGTFDYESAPEGLKWLLSEYAAEIKYIQANPGYKSEALRTQNLTKSVAPLLGLTAWNQGAPFNNNCPTLKDSQGVEQRTPTGCVATAMAQIMYYHKWPKSGTGFHEYEWTNGGKKLSVTLGHEYKWNVMQPVYGVSSTEEANEEVAQLMSDCGITSSMGYGLNGSGAYVSNTMKALATYFSYDKGMTYESRSSYRSSEWNQKLRDELDEKRPVLYDGVTETTNGGHAFVIDGYNTDGYFHVNWGWGGTSNGYFLTSGLTPKTQGIGGSDGGYNSRQSALFGCKPDKDGTSEYKYLLKGDSIASSKKEVALGESTSINYSLSNYTTFAVNVLSYIALCDSNGNIAYKQQGLCINNFLSYTGFPKLAYNFTVPATVAPGEYQVKILCKASNAEESTTNKAPQQRATTEKVSDYVEVQMDASKAKLYATVKDGNVIYSYEDITSKLSATIHPLNKKYVIGTSAMADVTFKNEGFDYYDNVKLVLRKANSTENVVEFPLQKIGLSKGEEVKLNIVGLLSGSSLTAGKYNLVALDVDNKELGETEITVNASEGATSFVKPTSLAAASQMVANNIEATVTLKNTGGYFFGTIDCYIAYRKDGYIITKGSIASDYVEFENGDTKTITLKGAVNAEIGEKLCLVMKDPMSNTFTLWSNIVDFTVIEDPMVGIETVSASDADRIYPNPASDVVNVQSSEPINGIDVYSLNGSKVMSVAGNGESSAQISVADLANGYYFVRVSTDKGISSYKLIKR